MTQQDKKSNCLDADKGAGMEKQGCNLCSIINNPLAVTIIGILLLALFGFWGYDRYIGNKDISQAKDDIRVLTDKLAAYTTDAAMKALDKAENGQ